MILEATVIGDPSPGFIKALSSEEFANAVIKSVMDEIFGIPMVQLADDSLIDEVEEVSFKQAGEDWRDGSVCQVLLTISETVHCKSILADFALTKLCLQAALAALSAEEGEMDFEAYIIFIDEREGSKVEARGLSMEEALRKL